jgi:hypothetical protein
MASIVWNLETIFILAVLGSAGTKRWRPWPHGRAGGLQEPDGAGSECHVNGGPQAADLMNGSLDPGIELCGPIL